MNRGKVLLVLCTIAPIVMLGQGLLSPVLPIYGQSFGVGAAAVGLLLTSFGVGRLLFDVPAGHWAQKVGRRRILVLGPTVVAVGSLLCYGATGFVGLVVFRFIMGAGSALYTTSAMTVLADVAAPEQRGRVLSLYQGALLLGSGLGPTVGGYAAGVLGYRAPFLASAVLAGLAALWAFVSVPETRGTLSLSEHTVRSSSCCAPPTSESLVAGIRRFATNMDFLLIAAVTFALFFTRTGSSTTMVPLLGYNELHLNEVQVGLTLTTVAALNFATLYPAGVLADRVGRKTVIVPAALVAGTSLVVFALARNFAGFIAGAALLGLGTGLAGAIPAAYVSDIAPATSSGLAMGAYRMAGDMGFVLGPVALGAVADVVGYRVSLLANTGLLVLSAVLFSLFARETVGVRRGAAMPLGG